MFVNIKEVQDMYFSSCDGCNNNCCSAPRVSLAPMVLDDFEYVYKNFAIQFVYHNLELKVNMVINQGEGSCKYYQNQKCSIYAIRPPGCIMFPISPYFDEFYINLDCQALSTDSTKGDWICKDNQYNKAFHNSRVENFVSKLNKTKEFLNEIEKNITPSIKIGDIQLFDYIGDMQNEYIDMYRQSLVHINKLAF